MMKKQILCFGIIFCMLFGITANAAPVTTLTGILIGYEISDSPSITIDCGNSLWITLNVPEGADITFNSEKADLASLAIGCNITVTFEDSKLKKITATSMATLTGILRGYEISDSPSITIDCEDGSGWFTLSVFENADITFNGEKADLASLAIGCNITVTAENSKVKKIVAKNNVTTSYAIVAAIDEEDVRLVLPDRTVKYYEIADSSVFTDERILYAVNRITLPTAITDLGVTAYSLSGNEIGGVTVRQYQSPLNCVVKYTLNNGKITNMQYQTPAYINANAYTTGQYKEAAQKIGNIFIDQDTQIIDVSSDSYWEYTAISRDILEDGEKYAGAGFGKIDETFVYSLVLLTNTGYTFNSKSRFAVVDSNTWMVGYDKDGDIVDQLKVLVNGQKTTLNFESKFAHYGAEHFVPVRGTAFFYSTDIYGYVDNIKPISMESIKSSDAFNLNAILGSANYNDTKWGTTLINGDNDIRLVKGIVVGKGTNTVKMIDIPNSTDTPIDTYDYEVLPLSDDCMIYTYNSDEIGDDILNAQGTLAVSNFNDWKITETPDGSNANYTENDIGTTVWYNAYESITSYNSAAFAAARGIKSANAQKLEGRTTEQDAQYAMALVVDGKAVEIYEIMQNCSEFETIYSGEDPVEVPADTFIYVSTDNKIKFGSVKYQLNSSIDIYINNYYYRTFNAPYYDDVEELMNLAQGKVRLVKNGSATGYNGIYIEEYEVGQITSVDYRSGVTTIKFNPSSANITSFNQIVAYDSASDFNVSFDGNSAVLRNLKVNDVIAIKTKIVENTAVLYSGNSFNSTILATRNTISGKVTSIDIEANSFTVDGKDYAAVDKYNTGLSVGWTYLNIFLDPLGRILNYYDDDPSANTTYYGIVTKIDDCDVTLVLPDGTRRVYEVKDNSVFAAEGMLYATGTCTPPANIYGVTANKYASPLNCVVAYKLRNGWISYMDYQTPFYINGGANTTGQYRAVAQKIGVVRINSNTNILDVSGDSYLDYRLLPISQLEEDKEYAGAGFCKNEETQTYSLVLLSGVNYLFDSKSRFAVVDADDWTAFVDEDGDNLYKLNVLLNGQKTTLAFEPKFRTYDNPDYFGLARGTAFFYTLDEYGLVDYVRTISVNEIRSASDFNLSSILGQGNYDTEKWGSSLINSYSDISLVKGIIVGKTENTVRMIDIPATSDGPVDIYDFEMLPLADDCLIYTYNDIDTYIPPRYRLNPQGNLFSSFFRDWVIEEEPDGSLSNYTANDMGKIVWTTKTVPSAISWAKARGASVPPYEKTSDYAVYAMALVVDGKVVELYEIGDVDPYAPPYGDVDGDGVVTPHDNVYLARHLAGWVGYENINNTNSDINLDGNINAFDNIILARYLANWTGYKTLPYNK